MIEQPDADNIPEVQWPRFDFDDDPFDEQSPQMSQLQSRAWWYYVRFTVARKMDLRAVHASPEQTRDWLRGRVPAGEWRQLDPKRAVTSAIQQVHQARNGEFVAAATIFRDGPALSDLWHVLSESPTKDDAARRFVRLIGISELELCKVGATYFDTLLTIHDTIALHALCGVLSQHWSLLRLTGVEKQRYLALLDPQRSDDELELRGDLSAVEGAWVTDRWFKCARVCIAHPATEYQLGMHGLMVGHLIRARGVPSRLKGGLGLPLSQITGVEQLPVDALPAGWEKLLNLASPSGHSEVNVGIGRVALAYYLSEGGKM